MEGGDADRTIQDHCTDLLRQKLMCDADVGVLTYYWDEKVSTPRANFNTQHKCRDFEAVLGWSHKNAAKDPLGGKLTKTQGVVQYTAPPLVSMRGSQ